MKLTPYESEMLAGTHGPARQMALQVQWELGTFFEAERFIEIASVHDDGVVWVGEAPVAFTEHLVSLGARVAVPTSVNAADVDLRRSREMRFPEKVIARSRRVADAHLALGVMPSWTCAPYQAGLIPRFGEQIAWAESNATAFVNSVFGARTNRYAGLIDICAAITGRVPYYGLHVAANRRATLLFTLRGFSDAMLADPSLYPLLGHLLGSRAGTAIAAIDGIPDRVSMDALKGFAAAMASSAPTTLFHMIGVTPEARTRQMCFGGRRPEAVAEITPAMVAAVHDTYRQVDDGRVDLVVAGCPHYSFQEFFRLLNALAGRRVHDSILFWVYTNRATLERLTDAGLDRVLREARVEVLTDGCALTLPREAWGIDTVMTDSMKNAAYCAAISGCRVAYGGMTACVETAVSGHLVNGKAPWS